MTELNTIERIRIKVGLTRPQMLRVLEAKPGRVTLFTSRDDSIDAAFLSHANALERRYEDWRAMALEEIDRIVGVYGDELTPEQAARVLGISEFHLVQIRVRGQVAATQVGSRRYAYTAAGLRELVFNNSLVVRPGSNKMRGPLANAFLGWLAHGNQSPVMQVVA